MVRLNLVDGLLMGYSGRRSLLDGIASAAEAAADDGEGGEVGIDTELAESVILLDGVEIDEDFFPDGGGADGPIPSKSGAVGYCCDGQSPDGTSCAAPGSVSRCVHPLYGRPVPPAEAEELIGPDRDGGLIWRAHLLPDDFAGPIKARRGKAFPVRSSDFFSSLVRIGGRGDPNADLSDSVKTAESADLDDEEGEGEEAFFADISLDLGSILWGRSSTSSRRKSSAAALALSSGGAPGGGSPRWVFSGALNGWPGLTVLELLRIDSRPQSGIHKVTQGWGRKWSVKKEGARGIEPRLPSARKRVGGVERTMEIRATLRMPGWSAHGWSKSSPGFIWWHESVGRGPGRTPRLTYGTDILKAFCVPEREDPLCERVTMVAHRYAVGKGRTEMPKDRLTYHTLALLEWDHRRYCTVLEIGYFNGLSGYKGKSNWFDDRDNPAGSGLYQLLRPEMIFPWKDTLSEIRCNDVDVPDLDGFKSYIRKYTGQDGRFVDPQYPFSHDVRLTYRSRRNIAAYLLNYIRRDETYSEVRRNCQTFVADLCGFLAGKGDVQPFHPVNQIQYHNRSHMFLYESDKFGR